MSEWRHGDRGVQLHAQSYYDPTAPKEENTSGEIYDRMSYTSIKVVPSKDFLMRWCPRADSQEQREALETLWKVTYPDEKPFEASEADLRLARRQDHLLQEHFCRPSDGVHHFVAETKRNQESASKEKISSVPSAKRGQTSRALTLSVPRPTDLASSPSNDAGADVQVDRSAFCTVSEDTSDSHDCYDGHRQ